MFLLLFVSCHHPFFPSLPHLLLLSCPSCFLLSLYLILLSFVLSLSFLSLCFLLSFTLSFPLPTKPFPFYFSFSSPYVPPFLSCFFLFDWLFVILSTSFLLCPSPFLCLSNSFSFLLPHNFLVSSFLPLCSPFMFLSLHYLLYLTFCPPPPSSSSFSPSSFSSCPSTFLFLFSLFRLFSYLTHLTSSSFLLCLILSSYMFPLLDFLIQTVM